MMLVSTCIHNSLLTVAITDVYKYFQKVESFCAIDFSVHVYLLKVTAFVFMPVHPLFCIVSILSLGPFD